MLKLQQLEYDYIIAQDYIDNIDIDKLDKYIVQLKEQKESALDKFKIGYAYLRKNFIDTALIYLEDFLKNEEIKDNLMLSLRWREVIDWGHGIHTVTEHEIPDHPNNNDNGCCECFCYSCCCCSCCILGKEFGCISKWSDLWGCLTTCPCCCGCCCST